VTSFFEGWGLSDRPPSRAGCVPYDAGFSCSVAACVALVTPSSGVMCTTQHSTAQLQGTGLTVRGDPFPRLMSPARTHLALAPHRLANVLLVTRARSLNSRLHHYSQNSRGPTIHRSPALLPTLRPPSLAHHSGLHLCNQEPKHRTAPLLQHSTKKLQDTCLTLPFLGLMSPAGSPCSHF
jgi:hypothetical protein